MDTPTRPIPFPPQPQPPPMPNGSRRHGSPNDRSDIGEWIAHYRIVRRLRNVGLFLAFAIIYGMALTDPPHPYTDSCKDVVITKPIDVNHDGFIECRSPAETGR